MTDRPIPCASAWDDNPWVAVTTFQVIRRNIDQMEE